MPVEDAFIWAAIAKAQAHQAMLNARRSDAAAWNAYTAAIARLKEAQDALLTKVQGDAGDTGPHTFIFPEAGV